MEDTDAADVCSKTLDQQFTDVQKKVQKSHVMEYGFKGFKSEVIGNFHGTCDSKTHLAAFLRNMKSSTHDRQYASVDSRYAKVDYLYNKFMRTQSIEDSAELELELKNMREIESRFESMRSQINLDFETREESINDFD